MGLISLLSLWLETNMCIIVFTFGRGSARTKICSKLWIHCWILPVGAPVAPCWTPRAPFWALGRREGFHLDTLRAAEVVAHLGRPKDQSADASNENVSVLRAPGVPILGRP